MFMLAARRTCPVKHCNEAVRDVCTCAKQVDLAAYKKPQPTSKRLFDDRRGSSTKRGYGSRWQKTRKGYFNKHPLCVFCERIGFVTQATVLDHIKPHKGDKKVFWTRDNWQGLCKHHHDSDKAKLEWAWLQNDLPDNALIGLGVKLSNPKT